MKRLFLCMMAVLLLIAFSVPALATESTTDDPWFKVVRTHYKEIFNKPDTVKSWRDGVKRDFNLELKEFTLDFSPVFIQEDEDYVIVQFSMEINALCYDSAGIKKRVNLNAEMICLIDKSTNKIVDAKRLNIVGPTALDGWDGKDV
jgi:hypothetical protein